MSIISRQPSRQPAMTFAYARAEQDADRIRGGCCPCPGGAFWICSLTRYDDEEKTASPSPPPHQQEGSSGSCCLCSGGGLCGVGPNKDSDDERLEMQQRARQEARARAAQSPVGARPVSLPQLPPAAATREPRTLKRSRTPSLPEGRPPPRSHPQPPPPQSNPSRRMPAKTLPPHLARPDLPQGPRQTGARTQSLSTRPRPGI